MDSIGHVERVTSSRSAVTIMGFLAIAALAAGTLNAAADDAKPRVYTGDSMLPNPLAAAKNIAQRQPIAVSLARNEFEALQLFIEAPDGEPLNDVTVTMGALRHTDDADTVWPPEDRSLWLVESIEVHNLWGEHESLGWFPDPLVPLTGPFSIPPGKRQAVWVCLHASSEQAPGPYAGALTVKAGDKPIGEVALEATVYPFTLPAEQHFTLAIPVWGGHMESMYPGKQSPESRRAYLDMLYDHRVAPFPLADDEIEHAIQRGMRDFNLVCFPKDYVAPETAEKAATAAALWRANGWNERARTYVLLGDEAPRKYYPNIREQGQLMHKLAPDVARRFTVGVEIVSDFDWITSQMKGAADTIILSAGDCYDTDANSRQIVESGFGLWWYYVASHYYIPDGCGAVAAPGRHVFWRHWKYRVPGQLHWGMSYWGDTNIAGKDGKKWPNVPWDSKTSRSGDGYLVYPAPDGATYYPSMRLEQLRDGIEDYEYFHLLDELTARLEKSAPGAALARENQALLRIDDALVRSYKDYSRDPAAYRRYRQRLADAIVATQRLLKP